MGMGADDLDDSDDAMIGIMIDSGVARVTYLGSNERWHQGGAWG